MDNFSNSIQSERNILFRNPNESDPIASDSDRIRIGFPHLKWRVIIDHPLYAIVLLR